MSLSKELQLDLLLQNYLSNLNRPINHPPRNNLMDIINSNNFSQINLRQCLVIKLHMAAHNLDFLNNNSKLDHNISILILGLAANNMECKPKAQGDQFMEH
jgi:hypothetical protein